jgi:serine phosphatase RsbU (regulator of sigma subunit)
MSLIRRSIVSKHVFVLFLVSVLLSVLFGVLSYKEVYEITLPVYFGSMFFLLLLFTLFYSLDVIRPLKKVLREMQALITGKDYKKIYTERVDEIGILAHFFNQVTKSFSKVSDDIADRNRLVSDLDVASQLQEDILPKKSPIIKGLEVVAKTKPATELGGDAFNFFRTKDKVYIYIGDVTGHGVAAGLVMTMANSLISVFSDIYDSAYDVLVHVNQYIKRHVHKAMFMTMLMLCWDEKKQSLSYVGAGHEHILVYRAETGECESILAGGVALGMVPDNSQLISEKTIDLSDGDFVILYSDGIIEARNKAGDFFGLDQLKVLVQEFAPKYSAEGVNYHIAKSVSAFIKASKQLDDITLIVIKKDSKLSNGGNTDMTTNWQE